MGIIGYGVGSSPRASSAQYSLYNTLISVGWVSQGEGNGISGGMGTTGVVDSGTFVWCVLKHPSSSRQVMFSTEGNGTIGYSYDGSFSGGSASSYPTSGNYGVTSGIYLNIGGTYSSIIAVQDVEPYNFIIQGRHLYFGAITQQGSMLFTYLDYIQDHDVDPFVIAVGGGSSSSNQLFSYLTQFQKAKTLVPGSTTEYMTVSAGRVGYVDNQYGLWAGYAPLDHDDGYYQTLNKIVWAKESFNDPMLPDGYKGTSSFFLAPTNFLPQDTTTQQATYNNETAVYGGRFGFIIPWDGDPVPDPA
jgi:hypothetical protein